MIPLRVCIAISIHKRQGMTIGLGEVFEKVVVYLPEDQCEQSPGLELMAFARAKGPDCLAVANNSNNLTIIKRALCHFTSSHSRGYHKIGSNQNGYRKNLQGWL